MAEVRQDLTRAIYEAEGASSQECRPHLGGSAIGKECERSIYLSYRWAKRPSFEGRMLRLFQRGHDEEPRLVSALQKIGIQVEEVDPETGDQWHVEMFPGFSGSADGIGVLDGETMLLEFKTHSHKSFLSLVGCNEKTYKEKDFWQGSVKKSKPEHYAQMQTYMGALGLDKALYMAVNKNDDALYLETIDFEQDVYGGLLAKAKRIIHGYSVPPKSFEPGKMSPCNFCDFKEQCHGEEKADENCRTCKFVKVTSNNEWQCHKHNTELTTEEQRKGCESYERKEF